MTILEDAVQTTGPFHPLAQRSLHRGLGTIITEITTIIQSWTNTPDIGMVTSGDGRIL